MGLKLVHIKQARLAQKLKLSVNPEVRNIYDRSSRKVKTYVNIYMYIYFRGQKKLFYDIVGAGVRYCKISL